ncbi:tRNA (guanosine(37)-N1)-methyltransferase TrmD [Actinomadura montaniterrae]|uniref:tRNA (guanine-N(1)-)-methyltransferase n=1 Tax=Actinomadura montaniterrae TaxID=1803903 RepID=A0A6L3VX49_9ACTN|nr:tRNA (guanosine(37)-N1)-methyltransferase TrmD [Actinomadura montaniterrae]KAB2384711.1 tRNA (guanosine(37)-N1)-methyltransferase TrmD [Actinomadura montaniterrae]
MKLDIVTIFPEYFAPLEISLLGKARRAGLLDVHVHDLRDWTHDRHRTVDDTPYGGGPGMVMKPDPWGEALDTLAPPNAASAAGNAASAANAAGAVNAASADADAANCDAAVNAASAATNAASADADAAAASPATNAGGDAASAGAAVPAGVVPRMIIPTPSGRPFTQALAAEYAAEPWLLFACGRYEGIDSRVAEEARTRMPVDEVSLGDFVLAGGEVAVLVMVEAIGRLLPGVLGNVDSVADDSFAPGPMESLLEGPVYTKPPVWRDRAVPDVLLSGHHGAIARWRRDEALRRTARHRPELLSRLASGPFDEHDRRVLREAGFPVDAEDMAD